MRRSKQYPNDMLMAALEANPFNVTKAIETVGISASQWYSRFSTDKKLIAFKKSLYARLLDMYDNLADAILQEEK